MTNRLINKQATRRPMAVLNQEKWTIQTLATSIVVQRPIHRLSKDWLLNFESKYFHHHVMPNKWIKQAKTVTEVYRININNRKFLGLERFSLDFITSGAPEFFFVVVLIEWKNVYQRKWFIFFQILNTSHGHNALKILFKFSSENIPLKRVLDA